MSDQKYFLKKTVYAKRKPFTDQQLRDVVSLDIQTHLRNNPDVVYSHIADNPQKNDDRSTTYTVCFKPKIEA